ncbi:surface glycan-binding family protein [Bacteroides sp. 519]|uniref:surface glycan-binding family protein n=1 Tax=Bacteroides sp. 519 TaxID=2302937 RepID=UPI0013D7079E|nr:surface glycan-binding family protein [Bacteroides sp. 519]NDV57293.1 DUF4958 domain-containing protein [Bacteroides sp. 519]
MNLKHITLRFLTVMLVAAALLTHISCDDTETTDSTTFILYYPDLTDIGPSMIGKINSPDLYRIRYRFPECTVG